MAAVGSGTEARCSELASKARELEGRLQVAVVAEKAAVKQLAAVSQVRG